MANLPDDTELIDPSVTQGGFKTALQKLTAFLRNGIGPSGDPQSIRSALGLNGVPLVFNNRGAWVTATAYAINDTVSQSGVVYLCLLPHTAGTFATDLAAGRWMVWQGVTLQQLQGTGAGQGASQVGMQGGGTVQSMFTGVVNVLQYGADGSGGTDCSAAVTNAVAACPVGGTLIFPPGNTFRFDCTSVGYRVLINKSLNVIATGANFDIHATVKPTTWAAEQHNAIFRVQSVSGFSWVGGTVNGNRNEAIPPWVGFIVGHGCSDVEISKINVHDLDHSDGSIRFDCLMPDRVTLQTNRNLSIHHCVFYRCSYGPFVIGSVDGCDIGHCVILDSDIQEPQSGHARGWSANPSTKRWVATIAVYGFDADRAATAGPQRGVVIHDCYMYNCTQGPVAYNDQSWTKTDTQSLDCIDISIINNSVLNTLTGIHINGWELGGAHNNRVTRLCSADFTGYAGTALLATTAGQSGALIEIATSGRQLSATGNVLFGGWKTDGSTDLSGSVTGILIGVATQGWSTGQRTCSAEVSGNSIEACLTGVLDVGVRGANVTSNRFKACKSFFTGNTFPRIGGQYSEGKFSGNTILLVPYVGTKVGGSFRGGWDFTENTVVGDPTDMFAYGVTFLPGLAPIRVANNVFRNMAQGVQFTLSNTPTGAITSGTTTLTLSAPWVFSEGQTINVAGAGVAGATLTTTISAVAYNTGTGVQTLTLAASASTTVTTARLGGANVMFTGNSFLGCALPVEIGKDPDAVFSMFDNKFLESTRVLTFTGTTHGTYVSGRNEIPSGGLVATAEVGINFPVDMGYRTAAPSGSVGWTLGSIAHNSSPTSGGTAAWVCTSAGVPGTWTAHALP